MIPNQSSVVLVFSPLSAAVVKRQTNGVVNKPIALLFAKAENGHTSGQCKVKLGTFWRVIRRRQRLMDRFAEKKFDPFTAKECSFSRIREVGNQNIVMRSLILTDWLLTLLILIARNSTVHFARPVVTFNRSGCFRDR